ncbi:MAG: DinB family protein [Spirochaetales bacterium]|nr:DinB family protein [Spirochaetales bacterium]
MTPDLQLLAEMADREFRGHTFNGQSLMETLRQLTPEEAADRNTVEGYSAWDNLVHCIFFKYAVVRHLGNSAFCDPYPWQEGSFPPILDVSPQAWSSALGYAEKVHEAFTVTVRGLDTSHLNDPFPAWDCTLSEALLWIPPHDTYHTAQVRNMGLARFRRPRQVPGVGF